MTFSTGTFLPSHRSFLGHSHGTFTRSYNVSSRRSKDLIIHLLIFMLHQDHIKLIQDTFSSPYNPLCDVHRPPQPSVHVSVKKKNCSPPVNYAALSWWVTVVTVGRCHRAWAWCAWVFGPMAFVIWHLQEWQNPGLPRMLHCSEMIWWYIYLFQRFNVVVDWFIHQVITDQTVDLPTLIQHIHLHLETTFSCQDKKIK